MQHEHYMKLALLEAEKGRGHTSPNPMVGAIIVKNDRILSKGYHKQYGGPHAEIEAISNASEAVDGSTMYVTLEPCSHYGKTPPCSLAIVKAQIEHVVIGMIDPNPDVQGRGAAFLEKNGIKVTVNVLNQECQKLNEVFIHYITQKKPYFCIKGAMTLDGKTATRTLDSKWITSEESRKHAHFLRKSYRAIMVGVSTIVIDNPTLTCRHDSSCRQPIRIILDSKGRIPLDSIVLNDQHVKNTWVVGTNETTEHQKRLIADKGARVITLDSHNNRVDLNALSDYLYKQEIDSVLVEGGGEVHFSALSAKVIDKVIFYIALKMVGGNQSKTVIGGLGVDKLDDAFELEMTDLYTINQDIVIEGKIKKGD